jgi:histidine triad (HIT) family protein
MSSKQQKLFENNEVFEEKSVRDRAKERSPESECAFCAIINGERSERQIVLEDTISLVFLDKRPVFLGHCLVVPKSHYKTLQDLPKDLVGALFSNVQLVARAVEDGLGAQGSFIAINNKISQSVPHLHVHVVPRRTGDGLRGFFWPRQKYESDKQAIEIAERIKLSLEKLRSSSTAR